MKNGVVAQDTVVRAMLNILFPMTDSKEIWEEYSAFKPTSQPEPIWQFSRRRYVWAKDQWPNLSDRITTIWTLQDFGMLPRDVDVKTVISVSDGRARMSVKITSHPDEDSVATRESVETELLTDAEAETDTDIVENDVDDVIDSAES